MFYRKQSSGARGKYRRIRPILACLQEQGARRGPQNLIAVVAGSEKKRRFIGEISPDPLLHESD